MVMRHGSRGSRRSEMIPSTLAGAEEIGVFMRPWPFSKVVLLTTSSAGAERKSSEECEGQRNLGKQRYDPPWLPGIVAPAVSRRPALASMFVHGRPSNHNPARQGKISPSALHSVATSLIAISGP